MEVLCSHVISQVESKPVPGPELVEGGNDDLEVHERKHGWDSNPMKIGLCGGAPEENLERRRETTKTNEVDKVWLDEEDIRRRWWNDWEKREQQRPVPQEPPRAPDMEFSDQTVHAVGEEGGAEVFPSDKDIYMRTSAQLQDLSDAKQDQRKLGGGVYRCVDKGFEDYELAIQKGFKTKVVGISLKKVECGKRRTIFQSFSVMGYEFFLFGEGGQRVRQKWPEETLTGWMWQGHGGDTVPLPTSDVYTYIERVDKDMHFSGEKCSRNTEAVEASQMLCCNPDCGVITWHLSRKCFRKEGDHFQEKWQEDFALVRLRTGKQVLIWSHGHRHIKRSRWERYESSPMYDAFVVDRASRERVDSVIARKCLPQHIFSTPSYVPLNNEWKVMEPMLLQRRDSRW